MIWTDVNNYAFWGQRYEGFYHQIVQKTLVFKTNLFNSQIDLSQSE